jgi:hypothetical protein
VRVTASGATIRAGLADTQFPGIGERLVAGQKLRPDIAVAGALPARRSHAQIAAALLASDSVTAMHPGDNVDSNQNIHL